MEGREFHVISASVFNLVSSSNCSSYDCEFVALAQSFNLSMYTSDKKVVQAFPDTAKLLKSI
jgi:predicted nucleic acid-binding protein